MTRRYCMHIILMVYLITIPVVAQAQRTEAMFKTDYIFTIGKDIEWDDEQGIDIYHVGVFGANDIYEEIQNRVNSFRFKKKPIDVKQFRTIRDISFVHILVIGKEKNSAIERIFQRAKSPNMLIVTDSCMQYEYIMVNLLALGQPQQQYELNSKNINEANMQINLRLLYYAGSEEDLRDIYKVSEQELSKVKEDLEIQKTELQQLYKELQMKQEDIVKLNKEIESQQDNLSGLLNQVRDKEDLLNQKNNLLSKQEEIVKAQQADIQAQHEELLKQVKEIKAGNEVLENQKAEIQSQLDKIENQNSILTEQTLKIEQQQNILYVFMAFSILIAGLVFFIFRAYRIKKTANKKLEEKNVAISKQNVEISQQKEEIAAHREQLQIVNREIEKQNKNIKSSIEYALTIQRALLPLKKELDSVFETFIIYRPKDIVSGDFYWFTRIPSNGVQNEKIFMAVVDCTGHGVPGAFLSTIGIKLLNSIIIERKVHEPNRILDLLNEEVIVALKQDKTENDDGMDVCLCLLQKNDGQKVKITFSGARRPLYYYLNGSSALKVLPGDRKTVGGRYYRNQIFTNKELILETDDRIYLTSDGMADQNASNREKFGTKRLLTIIKESATLSMDKQRQMLEERMDSFMQNERQRDDMTILGLRL